MPVISSDDGRCLYMGIRKDLSEINALLMRKAQEYTAIEKEIAELNASVEADVSRAKGTKAEEERQWADLKQQLTSYCNIARENTNHAVNPNAQPYVPDMDQLGDMLGGIDTNNRNDPNAYQAIELISHYLTYVDEQLLRIQSEVRVLENDVRRKKQLELDRLESRRSDTIAGVKSIVRGQRLKDVHAMLERVVSAAIPSESLLRRWRKPNPNLPVLVGFERCRIRVPRQLANELKFALGKHGAGNSVLVPIPLRIEQGWHIKAKMQRGQEQGHYNALQTLLTELFTTLEQGKLSVTVVDLVHFNLSCLGEYSRLQHVKSSSGVLPLIQTSRDRDELENLSKHLISQYKIISQKTGPKTVFAYNQCNSDAIPYNLLVLVKDSQGGYVGDWPAGVKNLINNARAYGVTVIELEYASDAPKRLDWVIHTGKETLEVACLPKIAIPESFVDALSVSMTAKQLGTKYTLRHTPSVPTRSKGKRRPIEIPFAVDSSDREITCRFEDDDFAAYIMGAAGSGKSTLIHSLITGLVSNYHPDEVELWLVDFKRTEFMRYAKSCPPHVRYVLLEESEELLFDLIDELTRELNRRLKAFAGRWTKLSDIPPEKNMPALFVIIDEFAQVSQHLRETRGNGAEFDYTLKLENLLAKGRAAGLKFIFASQSFSTGVAGLTETARKQIKMRFALRNTSQEIRETLGLMSNQTTDDLLAKIASIQKYQTIFVRSNPAGGMPIVDLYNNEYVTDVELEKFVGTVQRGLTPLQAPTNPMSDNTYLDKHPVLLVDDRPHMFSELVDEYRHFEKEVALNSRYADIDLDEDYLLYPGVPCSFNMAKPLVLRYGYGQNILLINRSREDQASIAMSLIRSWAKYDRGLDSVEIWAGSRSPLLRRYGKVFSRVRCIQKPDEICKRFLELQGALNVFEADNRLIIAIDVPEILDDCSDYASMDTPSTAEPASTKAEDEWEGMSLFDLVQARLSGQASDADIEAYNNSIDGTDTDSKSSREQKQDYDASQLQQVAKDVKPRLEELLQRGSRRGIHMLATFNRVSDFDALRLKTSLFEHKIASSLSRMESNTIFGNHCADGLEPGTFVCTDGERKSIMRPHIFGGIPNNGWIVHDGKVINHTL